MFRIWWEYCDETKLQELMPAMFSINFRKLTTFFFTLSTHSTFSIAINTRLMNYFVIIFSCSFSFTTWYENEMNRLAFFFLFRVFSFFFFRLCDIKVTTREKKQINGLKRRTDEMNLILMPKENVFLTFQYRGLRTFAFVFTSFTWWWWMIWNSLNEILLNCCHFLV